MNFFEIIYRILISPLQIIFEYIYSVALKGIHNPGLSIIALSLAMNLLVLPLYNRADKVQEEERETEKRLRDGVAHIKKTFKGDEKMMLLQVYYKQNGYKPTDVFKGSVSLLLEIPFFIAAYRFLSTLSAIKGVSFGPIADLGAPDALITIGALSINILPIVMTAVNMVSCVIFTKDSPLKTKIQLYGMAVFFLFFLYKSPSGLVFYWTLNNVFSLGKTIYYKSQTAKKVFNYIFALMGTALIVGIPFAMRKTGSKSFLLIMGLFAIICFIPLVVELYKTAKKKNARNIDPENIINKKTNNDTLSRILRVKPNAITFSIFGLYLTVLIGILIPSAVIKSSPQEFVDIYHFKNPLWFVVSSACIAFGLFVIWLGVFYALSVERIKQIFILLAGAGCIVATVDYMFFGKNRVILSSALKYTDEVVIGKGIMLVNLATVVALMLATAFAVNMFGKKVTIAFAAGIVAMIGMSIYNFSDINGDINNLKISAEAISEEMPHFTLSKTGKNVIVFMIDRGISEFVPYQFAEKPELAEQFDGFSYYPNTLSYGVCTNYGSPALFGGYEYTPKEMNKRDTELLQDKHDEALKVMPVLFYENGYNVTVCDPPYAGYQYTPDLSIYDDYPDMNTYITKGYFGNAAIDNVSARNYRNFFCYAFMKTAPLAFQKHFYDNGAYNEIISSDFSEEDIPADSVQIHNGSLIGEGYSAEMITEYAILDSLDEMTVITNDSSDNFLMIDNDIVHVGNVFFQEPDYTLSYHVDNTEYEANHYDRFTLNGESLNMSSEWHYAHYQANMAAFLKIGEWLDYLKEQGVYDNTRIIIVSDHGSWLALNEKYILGDGSNNLLDIECFNALLMIKDFDSHGFNINEEFMTNADVPTYAFNNLIDKPVNPFTGKEINNTEKNAHPQEVVAVHEPDVRKNNGTTFKDGIWMSVEKDIRDKMNWTILNN